jgi:hypothetical protein
MFPTKWSIHLYQYNRWSVNGFTWKIYWRVWRESGIFLLVYYFLSHTTCSRLEKKFCIYITIRKGVKRRKALNFFLFFSIFFLFFFNFFFTHC